MRRVTRTLGFAIILATALGAVSPARADRIVGRQTARRHF